MEFNKCVIEAIGGVGRDVVGKLGLGGDLGVVRGDVRDGFGELGDKVGNLV